MKKYILISLLVLGTIISTAISGISSICSAILSPKSFVLGSIASDPNQSSDSKIWGGVAVLFLIVSMLMYEETKKRLQQLKC